jgi:hypothetical protein
MTFLFIYMTRTQSRMNGWGRDTEIYFKDGKNDHLVGSFDDLGN